MQLVVVCTEDSPLAYGHTNSVVVGWDWWMVGAGGEGG